MVVDERSRHALFQRLEQTLGEEAATTLMEHLPPAGWGDVATRRDLESQIGGLRHDLESQIGGLRHDLESQIGGLRHDLESQIGGLRHDTEVWRRDVRADLSDVRQEMALLRADLRGELVAAVTGQTRAVVFSLIGSVATMTGVALVVSRLAQV